MMGSPLARRSCALLLSTLASWTAPTAVAAQVALPSFAAGLMPPLVVDDDRASGVEAAWSSNASGVSQAADCTFGTTPASASLPLTGGSGLVLVNTSTGCVWTASSDAPWLTLTGATSGTGGGVITYAYLQNTGPPRTGTVTIGNYSFVVTQAGTGCSFSVNPGSVSVGASSGIGSLSVTTSSTCNWEASSSADWLMISDGSNRTGPDSVSYSYTPNPSTSPRTATLTVAGQAVIVTQAGVSCSYVVTPSTVTLSASSGNGSITVGSSDVCTWEASSQLSWLSISSGDSGTGTGTVRFSYSTNTTGSTRSGTISVAGQTVPVTQAAATCTTSVTPTSVSVGSSSGTGSLSVTTNGGCGWIAGSNPTAWLIITGGGYGTGNGTITFAYSANTSGAARTGTITVGPVTVTVTQSAGSLSAPTNLRIVSVGQ